MRHTSPSAYGFLAGAYFFLFALLSQSSCATTTLRSFPARKATAVSIKVGCVETDGFSLGAGSGVLLDGSTVLTAAHVVDCDGLVAIVVENANGASFAAEVDKVWKDHDIARLTVRGSFGRISAPTVHKVEVDTRICSAVSYPRRLSTCGTVTELPELLCPGNVWCLNVAFSGIVIPGNSGGPLYDDSGALVALVTGGRFQLGTKVPRGEGFATSLYEMKEQIFN